MLHFNTSILSFLIALLPDRQLDRRTHQSKDGTELIFQISLIGEMEQPGVVAERHKMGRFHADLGHIINLQPAALVTGGCTRAVASSKMLLSIPVVTRMVD